MKDRSAAHAQRVVAVNEVETAATLRVKCGHNPFEVTEFRASQEPLHCSRKPCPADARAGRNPSCFMKYGDRFELRSNQFALCRVVGRRKHDECDVGELVEPIRTFLFNLVVGRKPQLTETISVFRETAE